MGEEDLRTSRSERLVGWKDIAGYLKQPTRTVQRWELKGLPVHRPGGLRKPVAYKSQLEAWLNSQPPERPSETGHQRLPEAGAAAVSESPQEKRRSGLPVRAIGAAAIVPLAVLVVLTIRQPTSREPSRPTLAVLGFRNLTGRADAAWLSIALSEAFRTDLTTGDKVRPVSAEDVTRMRRELSLTELHSLSKDTLARIRQNSGADIVLSGSYVTLPNEMGGLIRLHLDLQDTHSGETVASVSETGTEATLFELVSRAGPALRAKLAPGQHPDPGATTVTRMLPSSLEAQRLYSEGLEKLRLMDAIAARDILQRAVQAEPSYAMSHAALADAWAALGFEAKAKEEARIALDLSKGLAPEDALLIEAKYREWAQDPERAIEIYQKLCQFAPQNLDHRLRLAKAQASAGKGEEALAALDEARKLPLPLREDPRIDLAEAVTAESLGDFRREQVAAARAVERGESRRAPLLVARAQLREVWAFSRLGQPKKAIEKAELARQAFARLGDRGGEAHALLKLADVIDDQGNHAEARKHYGGALQIFREIGQMTGIVVTLNNLAYTYKSEGDLATARRMFEEAAAISREIADEGRVGLALNGIAIILWRQGELAAARNTYEEALRIHRARGDRSRAQMVQNNIGLVLLDQGHLDQAEQHLKEALQVARELEDRSNVARALTNIGDLLLKRGDLAGARKWFLEAVALGRAIPEDTQIAYALHGLGTVSLAEGNLKAARANHEEALAVRTDAGEKGLVAESQIALAEVALEEGDPTAAARLAQEAADHFRRENESDQEGGANAVLAQALLVQHRYQEAQGAIRRAVEGSGDHENSGERLAISLAAARVRAATGQLGQAMKDLAFLLEDCTQHGYGGCQLEATLALGEVELKAGHRTARHRLAALEQEARSKGFGLIGQKAAAALKAALKQPS